eukprot:COSAG06_NODE_269_length_18802_cov_4323.973479_11_plen_154_part_00
MWTHLNVTVTICHLRNNKMIGDDRWPCLHYMIAHRGASADDTGGERLVAHAGVTIRHDRCRLRASALANAPLEPARRESYTASLTRPYTAQGPSPLLLAFRQAARARALQRDDVQPCLSSPGRGHAGATPTASGLDEPTTANGARASLTYPCP